MWHRVAIISVFALAGAGCTNLSAVSDLSLTLSEASETWDDVAQDVVGSCERRIVLSSTTTDCGIEQRATDGLVAANAVLDEYFEALGAAANESNFNLDGGLGDVAGAVGNIPGVDSAQVEAASGLVQLLTSSATDRLRERTLRDLIEQGGPPAQDIVGMMDGLLADRLVRLLDDEQRTLDTAFTLWLNNDRFANTGGIRAYCAEPKAGFFPDTADGTNYLMVEAYCNRAGTIAERREAIAEYRESLVTAREALTELQSSRTKLKGTALAARLFAIGSDLRKQVGAVQKAFG